MMFLIIFIGLMAAVLGSNATTSLHVFWDIDRNDDGVILIDEMINRFNHDDRSGDGLLTLEEFAAGLHPGVPPLDFEIAFKFYDKKDYQEDGKLDPSAAVALFYGLDYNKNSEITLEEFRNNYEKFFNDHQTGR